MKNLASTFRAHVEQVMSQQGVTRAELARRMRVKPQSVTNFFIRGDLKLSTVSKLAKALSCRVVLSLE